MNEVNRDGYVGHREAVAGTPRPRKPEGVACTPLPAPRLAGVTVRLPHPDIGNQLGVLDEIVAVTFYCLVIPFLALLGVGLLMLLLVTLDP
jgi:hypothetical protein